MPGGRLSATERGDIASGLAAGLGYADIAARLGRPTSTVSREVNRNGGHNHYRADEAERRTRRRASRRGTRAATGPAAGPDGPGADGTGTDGTGTDGTDRTAADGTGAAVAGRLVAMMADNGLPRTLARVLVTLFLDPAGTRTAAALAAELQVSRATVSKAVGQLESMGFLTRERVPGRRTERYVLDPDVWSGVWTARTEVMGTWATTAHEAAVTVGAGTPVGARLEEWSRFLRFLHVEMDRAATRWPRVRDGWEPPERD